MQRGTNELQRPHIEELAMEGGMKGYQPWQSPKEREASIYFL